MEALKKIITEVQSIKDQEKLLNSTLKESSFLSEKHIRIVAWISSLVTKDESVVMFVKNKIGELSKEEKKIVFTASSRMSVTNPYFMGRNVHPLIIGGADGLILQPFKSLGIDDEIAYHYACVSFSLINGGYMCFNSHMKSLNDLEQDPRAIDQVLRLTVAISSIGQNLFNSNFIVT